MTLATPIEGITPRVQEIGRIRMGEKGPRGVPVKLKTFRLTSNDRKVLETAATLYGGKVAEWRDAPDEGMWQLVTAAAELDVLIPRALRSVSQRWELWQGGTCARRCDGRTEEISGEPCLCGPARGTADDLCDIVTRLSVILPRLPGLGVWRLDTGGWGAATTIPATLDLLLALDPRPMVPAVLRAVQASTRVRENGKVITHRFVRPQLDAPGITIGQLVGGSAEPMPQLASGDRPVPPTAEERVARQRAELEARRAAADDEVEGEASEVTEPVRGANSAQDAREAADRTSAPVETAPASVTEPAAASADVSDLLEGLDDETPASITPEQLKDGLKRHGIGADATLEAAKRLFDAADLRLLDGQQRALLLAELTGAK